MNIAFVGIGLMGHGMCVNLLKAGHALAVIAHRQRKLVEDLVARGAREAKDYPSLIEGADVLMLCVSNSVAVAEVMAAVEPLLKPGQVVIDSGTSERSATIALGERLKRRGVLFAEAPLTGGPEQAIVAELGALVGADDEAFAKAAPVLEGCCATISHMGPVGAGASAKLVSNYLVLGMVALICDSYNVARRAGVDWGKLYAAMLRGSNNSGALRKIVAPALEGDFDGYPFSMTNAKKDLSYYMLVAEDLGAVTDLARSTIAVYDEAIAAGHGDVRISRLIDPEIAKDLQ
ncbi:MAG: NAD(P)-dependent oxidoreductase [Parvibaculaceae bacterium]